MNIQVATKLTLIKKDKDRKYSEFITDNTPSLPYKLNNVSFLLAPMNTQIATKFVEKIVSIGNCRACKSRAKKFGLAVGPSGRPLFLANCHSKLDGNLHGLYYQAKQASINLVKDYQNMNLKPIVLEKSNIPKINEGKDPNGNSFQHLTIFPETFTEDTLARKTNALFQKYLSIISTRLEKLTHPHAVASIKLIQETIFKDSQLLRKDHWRGVFKWVDGIITFAQGIPYSDKTNEAQLLLKIFAITSGRSNWNTYSCVHNDYHQSDNICDFVLLSSIEDIIKEMNKRSDPEHYMVRQVTDRLNKERITSDYTVTLAWKTENMDDLDLSIVLSDKRKIYYGNKIVETLHGVFKLDFDANVRKAEKDPCENISCCDNIPFEIYVDNYSRRTRDSDVPFTIIISQKGKDPIIIKSSYPLTRPPQNPLFITKYMFIPVVAPPVEMSEKEKRRAQALNSKWIKFIGDPKAKLTDCSEFNGIIINQIKVGATASVSSSDSLNKTFMAMAKNKKKKRYLSEMITPRDPTTLNDLIKHITEKKAMSLMIDPRSFSPGYVTEPLIKDRTALKTKYVLNVWHDKFKIPIKPDPDISINAKFNNSFFNKVMGRNTPVHGFYKVNGLWFMALKDTKLPIHDENFPITNGFYSTDLQHHVHDLRDRWAVSNTLCDVLDMSALTPMIGIFMTMSYFDVILNGKKITLHVN